MTYFLSISFLLFSVFCSHGYGQVGPGTECLCYAEIGDGEIYNPVAIGHLSDGSGRILVAEQRGIIWIYLSDGSRLPTPFLNITDSGIRVEYALGLYNFAVHPSYSTTGLVYLHYTIDIDGVMYQRISEFSVSSDPNVLDPDTERVIIDEYYDHINPDGAHLGGGLLFDAEGLLHIHFGDGYCCYDPLEAAQNRTTFLGSIMRIDVDSRTGDLPYGIPPTNPFLDEPESLPEIYAFGVRNPYTAGMDSGDRVTGEGRGRMFFGEVGDGTYEEVNEVFSGANYGWPIWEGDLCHDPVECGTAGPMTAPSLFYNRTLGSCVIFGGIYRGCTNPDLTGWMLYGDNTSSYVFGATEQPDASWSYQQIPDCETCPVGLTNDRAHFIIGWGLDETGEHYIGAADIPDPSLAGGSVYKLVDPNNPGAPCPLKV